MIQPELQAQLTDMRHPYQPNNPDTGVLTYELLPDAIILEFRNHQRYLYTAERPAPPTSRNLSAEPSPAAA